MGKKKQEAQLGRRSQENYNSARHSLLEVGSLGKEKVTGSLAAVLVVGNLVPQLGADNLMLGPLMEAGTLRMVIGRLVVQLEVDNWMMEPRLEAGNW